MAPKHLFFDDRSSEFGVFCGFCGGKSNIGYGFL